MILKRITAYLNVKGVFSVDNDIFNQYYKKYYKIAYVYTFSLCGNKEMAEDITAAAFEKAFVSLKSSQQDFKYWILAVCKHQWIDVLRKSKYMSGNEIEEHHLASNDTVIDSIIQTERNAYLYKGIDQMPKRYREVLVLYYFSELRIAQIAHLTGYSLSNVKTTLSRARVKLKKILEEGNYEF